MQKLSYSKQPYLIWICLFTILACNTSNLKELPDGLWASKSPLIFKFEIEDTTPRTLIYKLHYTLEYPYQNHYLKFYLLSETDTLAEGLENIDLFDRAGRPLGEKQFGGAYIQRHPLLNYPFKRKSYQLTCRQYMREDTLKGVRGVGLEVN